MRRSLLFFIVVSILAACSTPQEQADLVVTNGTIYTVDDNNSVVEAVAVTDGIIIAAGAANEISDYVGEETQVIDLEGKAMTPGLIEAHGHFMGMGYNELNLDLNSAGSYEEVVSMVEEAVKEAAPGEWITGRGWHQSKWDPQPEVIVKGFQTHDKLSDVSPDNPVYLRHASGHAGFANARAMEIAGVNQLSVETFTEEELEGGEIITDELGNPTGVFNERAMGLITKHIPETTEEKNRRAMELAIKAAQRNGITSFHDAGVGRGSIDLFETYRSEGKLGVRLYVMVTGRDMELVDEWIEKGPQVDTAEQLLTIRSIKLNCDGALGSRGAWLLEPYTDRDGHYGHETLPMEVVYETSKKALEAGFQVCSHAIGDRANREILDRYEQAFEENPEQAEDSRFRIEHAQHLHPDDIPRFGELGVIASMQAIHMSSDRPWAIDRLGKRRIIEGAYVWQKLLQTGAVIINGTDVPVEPVNPIASFYASVSRKTLKGTPEKGYEPDQKMTREEALRSYTLDAAFGEFAEDVKGSIEVGKLADFTVYDRDLMTVPEDEILETNIHMTILGGEIVYSKEGVSNE